MAELTASVKETAALLGCGADRIYEMVAQDKIPHIHLGGRIVIPRAALDKWLLDTALAEVRDEVVKEPEPTIAPIKEHRQQSKMPPWAKPGCSGRRQKHDVK